MKEKQEIFKGIVQNLVLSIEKITNRLEEVDKYTTKSKNQIFERIKRVESNFVEILSGGQQNPKKMFAAFEDSI